jgi:nicotinamidase-related amidase
MPSALLVIDVQRILCSGTNIAHDVHGVIDRINLVSRKARAAGALVVVIQHETKEGDMDYGTDGWKLAPALEVRSTDVLLRKTASDSFHGTGLHELLASHGVTGLTICGLQSEFCVDTTTRRAMALGYPVVLVSDGHSTVYNGILTAPEISAHHNRTLSNIESFGARTTAVPAGEVDFLPEPDGAR